MSNTITITIIAGERALPVINHAGRNFVEAPASGDFALRLHNPTGARLLAVVAVDGKNILDGSDARPDGVGYVLNPYQTSVIPGWSRGTEKAANFTFTAAGASYTAQMGTPQSVGTVAMAVYRESVRHVMRADAYLGGATRSAGGTLLSFGGEAMRGGSVGAGYGAEVDFKTTSTTFERSSSTPDHEIVIQYATREDLIAWGVPVAREIPRPVAWPGMASPGVQAPPNWRG